MNPELLTMPWTEAHNAFRQYQALVKERVESDPAAKVGPRATREDVMLYRALRALIRGKQVIDLNATMQRAGTFPDGLPKLAIGRADWPFVHCFWFEGKHVFSTRDSSWGRRRRGETHVRIQMPGSAGRPSGKAQTPLIPPSLRPKGSLEGYHILWEAVWERQPPVDPLLLKHIDGPFYVVLGAWNLTPMEQAVLRARL